LTILSSAQHYKVPYGVIKFADGGDVVSITEKPEYTFVTSTGVYILNQEALQFIPQKTLFNMTDLIEKLIASNKKVITYLVKEGDCLDVGQWEEYKKAINLFDMGCSAK